MISVQKFHKSYGNTQAVRELSFEIPAGAILGMIGPNGAGKTTTMRAICGMITPTSGELRVAGFDVTEQPIEVKRRLAYIPDDPQLFPDLTVLDHLAFMASAYQIDDAEAKADRLLDQFELTSKRNVISRDLSRGMKQKLAICGAYLHDPQVLLFDEPLTGLDPAGIRQLKSSILERAAEGATIIVSSHLLAMVEDICTELLILDSGCQRFCGPVEDLRRSFLNEQENATLERMFFLATQPSEQNAPVVAVGAGV